MPNTPRFWLAAWAAALLLLTAPPLAAQESAAAEAPAEPPPAAVTAADRAREALAQVQQEGASLRALEREVGAAAPGEDRRVLERRLADEQVRVGTLVHDLGDLVVAATAAGDELGEARASVLEIMAAMPKDIEAVVVQREALLKGAAAARGAAPPEKLLELEQAVTAASDGLDAIYAYYVRHVTLMERLDLDVAGVQTALLARLEDRAKRTAARLQLTSEERRRVGELLAAAPDDAEQKTRKAVVDERFASIVASLRKQIGWLKGYDIDTGDYQKVLVQVTGDVSAIGLDTSVAASLVADAWVAGLAWLRENALVLVLKAVVIALVLAATWAAAGLARRLARRALLATGANVSRLLREMLVGVAGNLVLVLGVLVALSQLGISVGPMLAGLGIAGFIVGFALQDTLSNFASGVMILFYRPFDVGDVIEAAGVGGTVSAMNLVSTTVLTFDHQTLIVPNNKIWGDVIRNVTQQSERRVDLVFGIGYGDDIEHAERVFTDILKSHPRVLTDPAPLVRLHELGDSSVNFVVRPWVRTEDYWGVYWDITREVKRRFDAEGITIPFPQRDVHMYPVPAGTAERPAPAPLADRPPAAGAASAATPRPGVAASALPGPGGDLS